MSSEDSECGSERWVWVRKIRVGQKERCGSERKVRVRKMFVGQKGWCGSQVDVGQTCRFVT